MLFVFSHLFQGLSLLDRSSTAHFANQIILLLLIDLLMILSMFLQEKFL